MSLAALRDLVARLNLSAGAVAVLELRSTVG